MHLAPVATAESPHLQPTSPINPGGLGSAARLAVLLYLSNRPKGETRSAIAEAVKLDAETASYVLSQLRIDGKAACEGNGRGAVWFTPISRATAAGLSLHQGKVQADIQRRGAA